MVVNNETAEVATQTINCLEALPLQGHLMDTTGTLTRQH